MSRNKLYIFLGILCLGGFLWIGLQVSQTSSLAMNVCIFKQVTYLPCPSCGTSRSVISISKGDLRQAIQWNPFGFIAAIGIIVLPFWIIIDLLLKESSLFRFYQRMELVLKRKSIYVPMVLLVLINWVWNINKEL